MRELNRQCDARCDQIERPLQAVVAHRTLKVIGILVTVRLEARARAIIINYVQLIPLGRGCVVVLNCNLLIE